MHRSALVLFALVGCAEPEPELVTALPTREIDGPEGCSDGEDSDGDGLVDCLDPDCEYECRPDNRPPFAPVVSISPVAPTTRDDLVCSAATEDPDGDTVDHDFQWYFEGVFVADGPTLEATHTVGYDRWTCRAIPTDGALEGTPVEASVDILADDRCMALSFGPGAAVEVQRFAGQDLVGTDFTVEAWVRPRSSWTGLVQPVVASDLRDDGSGWRLALSGSPGARVLRFQLGAGLDRIEVLSGGIVPEDRWVHVAVTFDAATAALATWVDGYRVGGGTLAAPVAGASDGSLVIGADAPYSVESLDGEIDEVRISAVQRYSADFDPRIWFEPDGDTLGLWHLDEGTGGTTADVAEGRNGVLSGASWTADSACDAMD